MRGKDGWGVRGIRELTLSRKFRVNEHFTLGFRAESFHVTNTGIWAQFGIVPAQQYNFLRQVQLGLRLAF